MTKNERRRDGRRGDERRETKNERRETRNERRETGDERRETRNGRRETRDVRRETRDVETSQRRASERLETWRCLVENSDVRDQAIRKVIRKNLAIRQFNNLTIQHFSSAAIYQFRETLKILSITFKRDMILESG